MHSDDNAYLVFVSSTDHLGLIDSFGHHDNVLATIYVTDISPTPFFFNNSYPNLMKKKGKDKPTTGHMLHIFGCYGSILVSMVTDILGYLFPSSYNHLYATSMPK